MKSTLWLQSLTNLVLPGIFLLCARQTTENGHILVRYAGSQYMRNASQERKVRYDGEKTSVWVKGTDVSHIRKWMNAAKFLSRPER